ncbi:MAG: DNA polymerase III, subunit gamma and tau [Candidatus Levybacteria bacterium RIFCSPHIGHO2_01_FULL_38_26]|nr:MAG: DNA polymerase III, subunit gamma and tau [Candidatus Levybacteria bacterium RIFCSPHIGHO2_01_FULL_38_26]
MVFYRKYRPQKIEDLDSEEVRDLLSSVLSSKDIAHAFLFTGPKGLGKTSAARIVAKAVNCEKRKGVEPCNTCDQCISITNGTNIDVLEIDGASNRGIDEVRDLREKIRLAPARARRKVYIIDEVHMLTTEAFNALLKTLEEPPGHVIFVLCTTEPHKVPATIASRCFHITFKKATVEELVRSFERIVKKEKLEINKEALEFIASLSDGSFRDGSKILEEITLFSKGKKITREFVEEKYKRSNIKDQVLKMIEFLSEKNAPAGLRLVAEIADQGMDFKYIIEQLISELHEMLLAQVGIGESEPRSNRGQKLEIEEIKELVELLSKAHGELKYAVLSQMPLELVIVEWGLAKGALGSSRRLNDSPEPSGNTRSVDEKASLHAALSNVGSEKTVKSTFRAEAPRAAVVDNFWQELINKVKAYNHSIAGVLRGCILKSYDSKKLVIEAKYKFHKEKLEEKKTREILRKVSEEIAGSPIAISVVLKMEGGV